MEKIKEYKGIIIVFVIIIVGIFYWTEVRSVQVKKQCSWFTEMIPVDAGVTKEQALINKNKYNECLEASSKYNTQDNSEKGFFQKYNYNQCYGNDMEERPPTPERKEVREATDKEYKACLRQNGL